MRSTWLHVLGVVGALAATRLGAQPADGLPEWDEDVVVVAERSPSPASEAPTVRVVEAEELARSGALKLDDALRRVPGFTLFRRSGSRTANPTTQGVSLRGVGASGASRTLVLDDGVPLHDPFGAWVPWDRVPRLSLARAELLRGGGADLHGSGAMGGVVRLERRRPEGSVVELLAGADDRDSALLSAFASAPAGRLQVDASGDLWRTGGHVLVAPEQRGAVDVAASSRHELAEAGVRDERGRLRWRARVQRFDEARGNGTPLQRNSTDAWQLVTGGAWTGPRHAWTWSADAIDQDYEQSFSAIAADRATERLTREQAVPSRARGADVQWMRALGPGLLAAGASARTSSGRPEETFTGASGLERTSAGARQTTWGGWVEGIARWDDRAWLRGSLRAEAWKQDEARRSTGAVGQPLPSRDASALVPRVGAGLRVGERTWVSASAWKAFRAPTLNELYRDFRVGNVLTEANDALRPERLDGAEASVSSRVALPRNGRLDVTGTTFWSELDGAVGNVTISSAPDLIVRRRDNVGSLRSRGLELDARARWGGRWELGLSHALIDSRVTASDVGLEGKRAPQVPRHQSSVRVSRAVARAWQSLDARWSGSMPEDDRNELSLAQALVVDAAAGWTLPRGLSLELAAENVLDEHVEAGKTPALTLAAPRTLRAGLRWSWSGGAARSRAPQRQ